jgi:hypothetical protein
MTTKKLDDWIAKTHEEKEAREAAAQASASRMNDERAKVEAYTPTQFVPWHYTFLVEVKPCVHCARPTCADLTSRTTGKDPFPIYWLSDFRAQRERAGIQPLAFWHENNFPVCVGCKDAGKQTFECVHCKQARPLNESHSSYGAPAEHLCNHCYGTVPAKQWEGLVAELEETHRYDFE